MSLNKWREFLNEAPKRSSPSGIRRSLNTLLNTGPHSDGSPYKDEDEHLKGKKSRNQISAPPGAPGGGSIGAAGLEEDSESPPTYRKRIKSYTKDRDELLNVGGQKNTPPFTQKMGSHVTFDRQLEEEVEEETFEMQAELQPEIWVDNQMWPEVRQRFLEIVEDFLDGLDVNVPIEDVRLTGSLANYNWSKYSDADVHIVVDFGEIDEDIELVKAFFDAARARWNDHHDIKVYGFEVELYVENIGDPHHSSGVYSIATNKWIIEPSPRDIEIDFITARKKSDDIETQVNLVERILHGGNTQSVLKMIERIKHKIRRMRQAGLDSPQREFSPENIAFKILRRNGVLERLGGLKRNAYDTQMSLPEEASEVSSD